MGMRLVVKNSTVRHQPPGNVACDQEQHGKAPAAWERGL
jgi:hypothetical protein